MPGFLPDRNRKHSSMPNRKPVTTRQQPAKAKPPRLLSGGNPQIPKGHGDGPVQAYYSALTDWKQDAGRRIDQLITAAVPNLAKAVKWNSPLYGVEGDGWFLGIHVFRKYIKVAFFFGSQLSPPPPVPSKSADTRYLHVTGPADLDEAQFVDWVRQAASIPGWDG